MSQSSPHACPVLYSYLWIGMWLALEKPNLVYKTSSLQSAWRRLGTWSWRSHCRGCDFPSESSTGGLCTFGAWETVIIGQLIRMPGASQNGKGRKCAVSLRDCLVQGSHDAFETFTARVVWVTREFAGGWEMGAIAWGSLKCSSIVDQLGNSKFDLKTGFYMECFLCCPRLQLKEVGIFSMEMPAKNIITIFVLSWCLLRLSVTEKGNWFLRVRTKYLSMCS